MMHYELAPGSVYEISCIGGGGSGASGGNSYAISDQELALRFNNYVWGKTGSRKCEYCGRTKANKGKYSCDGCGAPR